MVRKLLPFLFLFILFSPVVKAAPPAPTPTPFTLKIGTYSIKSPVRFQNFGEILTPLLPYVFVIAGLSLFFIIVNNGIKLLTSGGDPKTIEGAKQSITAALVGFLLVIVSYWLIQVAEFVLHLKIF